jgi:octaprenyl-diphosphate synthase
LSNLSSVDPAGYPAPDPLVSKATISQLVLADLDLVEEMFRQNLASPLGIVKEIGTFVADGGGKRIRPTLHLLCAKLCRYEGPHHVLLATVLEFIHSATLIHDDIIDEATTRRGHESVNNRWGNDVTVLFGDYLFAKAMEMALQADSIAIMHKLADVTLRMTEGEMLQTRYVGRLDLTVEEYLDLVQRKTAGLFACCCDLAAMLAEVDEQRRQALRRFGTNLGMAFQLVDDVLDFTGTSETLGKPAASDLREGKATLAVIELLNSGTRQAAKGRDLARRIMESGAADSPEIDALNDLLLRSGALARAREAAESYAIDAAGELGRGVDAPVRRALATLPELILVRDR